MATSISYRHGTSKEHEDFRGAPSEITVSTDEQTLYVHSGNPDQIGTPLAKADLTNVETNVLKEKGLLDINMTNFRGGSYTTISNDKNTALGAAVSSYLDLIHQLGIKVKVDNEDVDAFASTSLDNVTTTYNLTHRPTVEGTNDSLAYANLSNVTPSILTDSAGSFKLAKLDLSNISDDGKTKIVDTVVAANSTDNRMHYASESYVNTYVDAHIPSISGCEVTTNKVQVISSTDSNKQDHYPSVGAVLDYISTGLAADFAKNDLTNIQDWTFATLNNTINSIDVNCSTGGAGYQVDDELTTNITIQPDELTPVATPLKIIVTRVDTDGAITKFEPDPAFTTNTISQTTYTDSTKGASFTIKTVASFGTPGHLAKTDLTNVETSTITNKIGLSNYLLSSTASTTYATKTSLSTHTSNTNNPHSVTKSQIGLGNVDNTSDADKPISTLTQTALNGKQATLVGSGTGQNIKTINNTSLLGSGNIAVATTAQGGKADTAVQPGDNVSTLTNDAGYITKSVNDLTNYTLSSSLKTVATSGSYNDLTNRPTIPTITNTYSSSSADGMSGQAVASAISSFDTTIGTRNYVQGVAGGSGLGIPTKIAIFANAADAQAASAADNTLIAFSLA